MFVATSMNNVPKRKKSCFHTSPGSVGPNFREKGSPPPSFPFIICGPKKWVGEKRVFGQPEKNMGEEGSSQDGHIGQSALGPAPPPNFLGNANEGILNSFPGCCTRGALARERRRPPPFPTLPFQGIQDDTTSVLPISCFQLVYAAPPFCLHYELS